jgi:hypothetical protein
MNESLFSKELLQCPVCLNEFEATIWQVLEADSDPDLKDKLLRKDLQAQQCFNCGHTWVPAIPLLYRDTGRKLLIYCHSGLDPDQARAAMSVIPPLPGWTLRLVPDYNSLIEKIHISDHRCDDRLIEFIKLAVKRQSRQEPDNTITQVLFLTANDQTFRFLAAGDDGLWCSLDLDSQIYLNAEALAEGKLADTGGTWQVVGERFAAGLLQDLAG